MRNQIRKSLALATDRLFKEAKKNFLEHYRFPQVGEKIRFKGKKVRVTNIKYGTIYYLSNNTIVSEVQIIAGQHGSSKVK